MPGVGCAVDDQVAYHLQSHTGQRLRAGGVNENDAKDTYSRGEARAPGCLGKIHNNRLIRAAETVVHFPTVRSDDSMYQ